MFLVDYIIITTVFISVFLGLTRGFLREFISSCFWVFTFYFFYKYYYFSSFYVDSVQNIYLKNKVAIFVVIFFLF